MTDQLKNKREKPPYQVPLMSEVWKGKTHGLKVAETFAGGGGSDTGWAMAGFEVAWANEFVPSAQETYRANHKSTILDCRDIKKVQPEEVLVALGLEKGELHVFSGSPPCQSFSTAGKREKGWKSAGGKGKKYEGGEVQHNEELFFEYIRLLRGLMPVAFVAENVKGLTIGKAKAMMGENQLSLLDPQDGTILHMLMDSGYKVEWRVLDAKHYGVPQTRNRVIFIGVRRDVCDKFGVGPCWPDKLPYVYTVRDACPWIGKAIHETGGQFSGGEETDRPAFAVTCSQGQHKVVGGLKPLLPFRKPGSYGVQEVNPDAPCPTVTCASPGNDLAVPEVGIEGATGFNKHAASSMDKPMPAVTAGRVVKIVQQQGGGFSEKREASLDKPLPCVCSGQASPVLYNTNCDACPEQTQGSGEVEMIVGNDKFQPVFGSLDNPSPAILAGGPHGGSGLLRVKPAAAVRRDPETGQSLELDESRKKVCDGTQEFGSAGSADSPSPPVLTPSNSVVSKEERRKFTIAELRRICSFPDDYVLTGSYAKQWQVCGNSVPPLMMRAIAEALRDGVFAKIKPLKWRDPKPAQAVPVEPAAPAERKVQKRVKNAPTAAQEAPAGVLDGKWAGDWWRK